MRLFTILLVLFLVSGCGGGGDNNEPENTSESALGVITLSGVDTSTIGVRLNVGAVGSSLAADSQPDYIVIVDEDSTVEFTPPNELTPYIADINNGFVLVLIDDALGVGKGISLSITVDGVKYDYICHTNAPTWSIECGVGSIVLDIGNETVSFNNTSVINTDTATILTLNGAIAWGDSVGDNSADDSGAGGGVATELEGTWAYTCRYDDTYGPEFAIYDTGIITFSGNTFVYLWTEYADSACTIVEDKGSVSGTFTVGNTITTSSGVSAKEINYVTFLAIYDIYRIDGDRLYFGDAGYDRENDDYEYSGVSLDERPVDLDFNVYYIRQ